MYDGFSPAVDALTHGFEYCVSDEDQANLWKFFCALNLAVPQKDEYLAGNDCFLVFLRYYGMVVRVGSKETVDIHVNDPQVLRPVVQYIGEKLVFELLPALVTKGATQRKSDELIHALSMRGINSIDNIKDNVGFLPNGCAKPILIDRGSASISRLFGDRSYVRIHDFQAAHFAPLNKRARQLLPDFSRPIEDVMQACDLGNIQKFWAYCEGEVQKSARGEAGVLVNSWGNYNVVPNMKDPMTKAESVPNVAARYMPS